MILGNSLFQTEVQFNAMADMPDGNQWGPYTACYENGTIVIDTSKRYTKGLQQRRFGTGSVATGSNPNAYPRNWLYSGWNNSGGRSGFVIAIHRAMTPSGLAPEYNSNQQYAKGTIYAIVEIPNAADGTLPDSAEKTTWITNIRNALANDNVNWGTVTSTCGVLPAGETTDPECTTDTYIGGSSNVDCGGYPSDGNNPDDKKKCGSFSDSTLVAGDTYKYKASFGGYTTQTVPEGTVICTYDKHNLPNRSAQWKQDNPPINCTADEDKVLGRGWGKTNGMWECIPKLGCKDLHNTNYADPDVRPHKNSVCDEGDCITGASKTLLGSGDGSCIKELDMFILEKSATGCCQQTGFDDCKCRYQVALGKSGWGKYKIHWRNFEGPKLSSGDCETGDCDQWKAGKSGSRQYDTLAEAQAVFDTMKAGAQEAMGVTQGGNGDDDDPPFVGTCADPNDSGYGQTECVGCNDGYEDNNDGLGCVEITDGDDEDEDDGEENNTLKYIGMGGAGLIALIVLSKVVG